MQVHTHDLAIRGLLLIHLGLPRRAVVNTSRVRRGDHREQRRRSFITSSARERPAPAPGIVAGARPCQGRSCPCPRRRGPGRGSTWTLAALRLVGRLSGAGTDLSRTSVAAVLELAWAREWLVRRAGLSGCEP